MDKLFISKDLQYSWMSWWFTSLELITDFLVKGLRLVLQEWKLSQNLRLTYII